MTPRATGAENSVDVNGVTMVYPTLTGDIFALDQVSFSVREGEFVAIVGPSGCGKSTLLALISGLEAPTEGQVRVGNREVRGPVTSLGIVFQTDVLLDWRRVLGNVLLQIEMRRLPKDRYLERARQLLRLVGLEGFEDKYPFELSGGMRQRVSICRALIHDPPLLLMDEPFGALDALTREQMVLELHHIWRETKKSVVFVTHDIEEAVFLANQVLVMTPRPGRIAEVIDVDLPQPRTSALRSRQAFSEYVSRIRTNFLKSGVLTEE
jgi:NitT/TauT family transport system ATP-binding protein